MAVKPQPSIQLHSKYLDVFLKWESSAAKRQPSCHCSRGDWGPRDHHCLCLLRSKCHLLASTPLLYDK
ncbi:hypothetical protein E2C01_044288 [Portunus trituberculatus]|uniref:Uncharacterized protein n=1 Tax=Portunus trituberculatus TaxID=210409 RepID=A0A5B7FYX4_PORTR|nr:hypothetical protein [Portunus trituberculatus]